MRQSLRRALEKLLKIDDTPPRVALAFGVGLFIAFFPLLGIHTAMALGVGFAFRLSRVALLAGAYVNNPWTLVPLYSAGTALGCLMLGVPLSELKRLGGDFRELDALLWPYVVGNLVAGAAAGLAGYGLLRRALERSQRPR
jgi:uncharacterized protein (DUF2062 family)